MSIILVGGHDRMHREYKDKCNKFGFNVKIFTQITPRFDKSIGTPDGMVVFTGTSSHKMVKIALKEASKKNIPVVRCHNSSGNSLELSLKQLEEVMAVNC